jgi:hypothetical protein
VSAIFLRQNSSSFLRKQLPETGRSKKIKAALISLVCLAGCIATGATAEQATAEQSGSCIILLHGLGRSSVSMMGVEWRLEEEGFLVSNNSYPWLNQSIEEIAAEAVAEGLAECAGWGATSIGFVTHSMGGIVLRQYLSSEVIPNLGRVVMLAPPNQGSVMADDLAANSVLGYLLPVPARQLGKGDDSLPQRLGPVNFELGVIAGSNSRALRTQGLDDQANDGTVAVEETRIEGMQDFIVLPVDHSFLMWRDQVLDQVVHFLRNGRFAPVAVPSNPISHDEAGSGFAPEAEEDLPAGRPASE